MMRVKNNGTKKIHTGAGKFIEPGHFFDSDKASIEKILSYCPFCIAVPDKLAGQGDLVKEINNEGS